MRHLLFFLLIAMPFYLKAQDTPTSPDTTQLWQVVTFDGNQYFGHILYRDGETIRLETEAVGIINIPVRNVDTIKAVEVKEAIGGQFWPDNVQATRYFWSPNGYGLKPGEGYYQNIWIFFNQVSVGLTENTSIGFGIVPAFLFAGAPTPIWITPKVSVPVVKDKFNLGGGVLAGTVLGEDAGGFFGIAYGLGTIGSRDKNLTVGLGYGFADGEWARRPTFTLSGMLRTGKKGYLLTETFIIDVGTTTGALIALGGRTVWDSIALDYGGIIPAGDVGTLIVIPWLGISVPFGK